MDLTTRYMGLPLKNPLVASSSPLTGSLDGIRRLEDAGAAAVVLVSLFEEEIHHENAAFYHYLESGSESFSESLSYFPDIGAHSEVPERYLNLLRQAVAAVDIPVIASLNGYTNEGWIDYARQLQEAGAHGLELNIYYIATDPECPGSEVERRYFNILRAVKAAVTIPVAMKLSPFFSSIGHMLTQLDTAGADALVLFNRFSQPDFNIERLEIEPTLHLSSPEEIRLPLLWIALLHGHVRASLGATRGVGSSTEVIKYLLAGADVVMTASALLRHGPYYLQTLLQGLETWLEARGFASVDAMRGRLSRANIPDPAVFERANYIKALESFKDFV